MNSIKIEFADNGAIIVKVLCEIPLIGSKTCKVLAYTNISEAAVGITELIEKYQIKPGEERAGCPEPEKQPAAE